MYIKDVTDHKQSMMNNASTLAYDLNPTNQ